MRGYVFWLTVVFVVVLALGLLYGARVGVL